jgi:hypothetical protein
MINGLAEENKLFQGARKPAASHQSSVISNQFWGKKILFNRDWPRLAATQQESTRFDVLAGALTGRQKEPKTSPFLYRGKGPFSKKKCQKVSQSDRRLSERDLEDIKEQIASREYVPL